MPTIVDVKGYGEVEFPDSMSEADIREALDNGPWHDQPPAPTWQPTITPPVGIMGMPRDAMPGVASQYQVPSPDQGGAGAAFGSALNTAGRLLWAGAVDAMGNLVDSGIHERNAAAEIPGYIEPPSNLQSVIQSRIMAPLGVEQPPDGEPYSGPRMPAESQLKFLGRNQQAFTKAVQGVVESVPKIGAMMAGQAAGLPAWAAGGAAFGFNDEGFDPKSAAIGALIPVAGPALGKWSADAAAFLVKNAGVSSVEAINFARGVAHAAGHLAVPAGIYAEQIHSINQMEQAGTITPAEADQERLTAIYSLGANVGQSLPGMRGMKLEREPVRPPIIPVREAGAKELTPIRNSERLTEYERAYLDAEREAIDKPIVVMDESTADPANPFARSAAGEHVLRANKDTGEIEVYPGALRRWLDQVPEGRRRAAMRAGLNEEDIHFQTPPEWARQFWDLLHPVQKAIIARIYTGKLNGVAPNGERVSGAELGYEALRLKIQQANREGPREFAEAALRERMTIRALLALDNLFGYLSENMMDSPAAKGQRQMIEKLRANIKAGESAVKAGEIPDTPQMRRKSQPELPFDDKFKEFLSMSRAAANNPDDVVPKAQQQIWEQAQPVPKPAIGEANIRESFRNQQPGQGLMDLPPSSATPLEPPHAGSGAELLAGSAPLEEGISAARAKLSSGRSTFSAADLLLDAASNKSVEDVGRRGAKILSDILQPASRLQERDRLGDVKAKRGVMSKMVEAAHDSEVAKAIISLVPVDVMNDLVGQKFSTQMLLDNPAVFQRALSVNVEKPIASRILDSLIHKQEFTTKGKYYASEIKKTGQLYEDVRSQSLGSQRQVSAQEGGQGVRPLQQPEEGPVRVNPAMRRKPQPGEIQTGMDFEGRIGATPPPEPTAKQTGLSFQQVTPAIMEEAVAKHLATAKDPTFEGFVEMAQARWPNVTAEQLRPAWKEHVWNGLMNASGEELKNILYRLDLGRSENRIAKGMFTGAIADATPATRALTSQLLMEFTGQPSELHKNLRNALKRASNAKAKEQDYNRLMVEAKKTRAKLAALGFENISDKGELHQAEGGAGIVNDESLGLARKLFSYRVAMDELADPQHASRSETRTSTSKSERRKGVTTLTEGEIKVPAHEEMARPAFQPGLPSRKGSTQQRAAEDRRLRVIATVGSELLKQAETPEAKLRRSEIRPEDIALQRGEDAIRRIDPLEAGEPGVVGAIITSAPQMDRTTIVNKVVNKQKLTVQRNAPREAETRNLVAVQANDGRVFLLSAYEANDGTVRVMDPSSPSLKRVHTPLSPSFLYRYKPIYHLQLDEPVRNFVQEFKSKDDLRRELLAPVRGMLEEAKVRQDIASKVTPEDIANERQRIEAARAQGVLTQEAFDEHERLLEQREAEIERGNDAAPDEPAAGEAESATPHRLEQMRPIATGLESSPRELAMRSPAEIAQENQRRAAAGLKPLGAGLERVAGSAGQSEATPMHSGSELLPPEQQEALEAQRPKLQEPSVIPPGADEAYYKYMMGGWPKFKSLGEREISPLDSPAMMRKLVKSSVDTINYSLLDPTAGVIRGYSGWMSQRLRENGGQRANEAADIFEHIIDRTKQHEGQLFADYGDKALKAVGAPGPLGTMLNGFKVVNDQRAPNAAIGNAQGMIEGWRQVPGWAMAGVQLFRDANLAAGRLVETVIPGFMANGSFERHLTPIGYDIITAGEGPLWDSFIEGEAVANNRSKASVARMYRLLKKTLDDPMPEAGKLDRMNQEVKRLLPVAVTHVKVGGVGIFGGWKQIRHANAFNYLNATLKRAAHMTAFREQFPVGGLGRSVLETLRNDIAAEPKPTPVDRRGPNTPAIMENFDSLLRALQGHPTDQYGTSGMLGNGSFRPGSAPAETLRLANSTVMNMMAKLVLTKQYIVQLPELAAGATPGYLGYRNYIEGLARHRELYPEMERTGSVNRILYDWSIDPSSPTQSLFRVAGNAVSKLTAQNFLNEMQEAAAAATAKVVTERISNNQLSAFEKRQLPATFKEMGFQPGEINAMMQGDPELLGKFERRAAAFLTGGNRHIAEGSRLGANRVFNSIFRFQSYPMMKANQLRQDFKLLLESTTGAARGVAAERMARGLFINTLQGAITAGLGAYVTSLVSPSIKWHEAKRNPMRFLLDSWFNAQSGPLYLMYNAATRTGIGGFGEQLGNLVFPWAMGREVVDYATGGGRYKYMDNDERAATFMRSKVPGLGPVRLGLSVTGLSKDNPSYDASRAAYYRWQEKYYAASGAPETPAAKTKLDVEFRKKMDAAKKALIRGDYGKYLDSVIDASGMKDAKAAAASLRGKKWLKDGLSTSSQKPDIEAIEDLIGSIGGKAYDVLETHDLMLEEAARSVHPPQD